MKNIKHIIIICILISIIGKSNLYSQFEQKLTMQLSAGYFTSTLSDDTFHNLFKRGLSFDVGVQYNFSRTLSVVALAKYSPYFHKPTSEMSLEYAKFNLLGVNFCPKLRFLPHKKFNPYLFAGAGLNYINIIVAFRGEEPRQTKAPICFSLVGGIGFDVTIGDNFALFWHCGINRVDYDIVFIDSFFNQFGININMFKSKTL